ncbi:GNAT family N-acetyltransferase [Litoribacter alkaliphilus]|uniref:GNAT family N-acetyltransferase n=1 Tax=Litoribacter ruber TaxID=702568 RepID=A0AAP2CI54_9BACT|nr:GNAT family N-acetyltransferase [Litoribacter alkaliphilus]MBS9524260.1 GNAT family N-acetyltransferase [Litoribacter alkaliphilus]
MEVMEVSTETTSSERTIDIVVGNEALNLLENKQFCEQWDSLYESCTWATVFQSRQFVTSNYTLTHQKYTPVIVKMEHNGKLTGLLTLAINPPGRKKSKKNSYLVGAGHGEADYHAWLTSREDSTYFVGTSFRKLLKMFPGQYISLRHLNPDVPTDWVEKDPEIGKLCVFQPFNRALVDLDNYQISKRDRKRINRMNRIGQFEEVKDLTVFESIIDDLGAKYDFRQAAMFNQFPFSESPTNRKFLLDLFKRGVIRVTIFRTKDDIIAGIASVHGKERAILGGINFHLPSYSYYSPGYIQFLLLFDHLSKEKNHKYFDLTPGDDPYKMRLASKVETVYKLSVTPDPIFRADKQFKIKLYDWILSKGHNPYTIKLQIDREKYIMKEKGMKTYLTQLIKSKIKKPVIDSYNLSLNGQVPESASLVLKRNNLKDLLDYQFDGTKATRWEFYSDGMRKMEANEECFTWAKDEVLLASVWFKKEKREQTEEEFVLVYDFYFDKEAQGSEKEFFESVLKRLKEEGIENVQVKLGPDDKNLYSLVKSYQH